MWTALHYAAAGGHSKCIEFLLEKKDEPLVKMENCDGDTAFVLAAKNGHDLCLVLLYNDCAGKDETGQKQRSALGWSVYNAHTQCVDTILGFGADFRLADEDKKTPMQLANELLEKGKLEGMSEEKMDKYTEIISMLEQQETWR